MAGPSVDYEHCGLHGAGAEQVQGLLAGVINAEPERPRPEFRASHAAGRLVGRPFAWPFGAIQKVLTERIAMWQLAGEGDVFLPSIPVPLAGSRPRNG
jgi:hypothetical protein